MMTNYNIFRTLNSLKSTAPQMNFESFQLISKLPYAPYYNEYKFIPTIHKTNEIPQSGLYFNKEIYCADDMTYHTTREFNDYNNKNIVEYRALGFRDRLQQVMMQASANPLCEKAKYIIFTCNAIGYKYNNSILGVFENKHQNADNNMRIEYELYSSVENK